MKKLLPLLLALAACLFAVASCGGGDGVPSVTDGTEQPAETSAAITEKVKIYSIEELNRGEMQQDDHADDWANSYTELDRRSFQTLRLSDLRTAYAYYPRVAQLADGSYMMTYQDGRWGPDILCMFSDDLTEWSSPSVLFAQQTVKDGADKRNFATAFPLALSDGSIVVACCYRSANNYTTAVSENGLCIKRSTDGGKTFGEIEYIYTGTTWEPSLMQLPNGELQLYFTHVAPYIALYGYNTTIRSSGCALLRSFDSGASWSPDVKEYPYAAYRVMQSYIGMLDGRKIFNDQMPAPLLLHNGTIALAAESQQLGSRFFVSVAYSADNWADELDIDEAGPTDRQTNLVRGVAPWLAQFPSGETLLIYSSGTVYVSTGDSEARRFSAASKPMEGLGGGLWAMTLITDPHTAYLTTDNISDTGDNSSMSTICCAKLRLCHTLYAKKQTGAPAQSPENDAIFAGSVSQAQATLSVTYDSENVYILCDRLDRHIEKEGDELLVFAAAQDGSFYKMTLDAARGLTGVSVCKDGKYTDYSGNAVSCSYVSVTSEDVGEDDTGAAFVLTVSRGLIDGADGFPVNMILKNTDGGEKYDADTIAGIELSDISGWIKVLFK